MYLSTIVNRGLIVILHSSPLCQCNLVTTSHIMESVITLSKTDDSWPDFLGIYYKCLDSDWFMLLMLTVSIIEH